MTTNKNIAPGTFIKSKLETIPAIEKCMSYNLTGKVKKVEKNELGGVTKVEAYFPLLGRSIIINRKDFVQGKKYDYQRQCRTRDNASEDWFPRPKKGDVLRIEKCREQKFHPLDGLNIEVLEVEVRCQVEWGVKGIIRYLGEDEPREVFIPWHNLDLMSMVRQEFLL